jgi:hypothetical protein
MKTKAIFVITLIIFSLVIVEAGKSKNGGQEEPKKGKNEQKYEKNQKKGNYEQGADEIKGNQEQGKNGKNWKQ